MSSNLKMSLKSVVGNLPTTSVVSSATPGEGTAKGNARAML